MTCRTFLINYFGRDRNLPLQEPDSEEFSAHYVSIHNYWKSLESKCVPKYNSTLKRDRIEDLAGRYASFGVNSLSSNAGSDDTLTTEDMKFIDDSQFVSLHESLTSRLFLKEEVPDY